jgi:hypothetical protein
MKIYHAQDPQVARQFAAMVVIANDEEEARELAAQQGDLAVDAPLWLDPQKTSFRVIGDAGHGETPNVVVAETGPF